MMRWVVPVMASIRRSTRRATKMPPPMPSTTTTRIDHCAALRDDAEQPPPFLQVASDQKPEAAGEFGDQHQRAMVAQRPDRQAAGRRSPTSRDVPITPGASEPTLPAIAHPGRGGHEIKIGARPQRAVLDRKDQAAQAAAVVDVADLAGFRIHRGRDLFGDQPARVPGEIAEQRGGEQRKQKQIDQRQPERRGSDQLTECRHESCIQSEAFVCYHGPSSLPILIL